MFDLKTNEMTRGMMQRGENVLRVPRAVPRLFPIVLYARGMSKINRDIFQ